MSKYSKEQLQNLAKGVFACSPKQKVVYANGAGTFYNEGQYARLDEDGKDDCLEIKNPAFESVAEETEEQKLEREAKEEAKRLKAEDAAKKKADAEAKKQQAAADAEAKKKDAADKKAAKATEAGK